ncbi:flippase-like domain-containing protein [Natroniella acetigena]|uniref:lysylphosphatidylglycerol synthase transmembrane domain-containing protein n=1 Tax=Natroniella acetigena TaxID=52004 RepID=UPI00200A7F52|nr:lysylphosphatidylglycerol synthase transmembrane domain-containing protein [Natroniella acetigena]MCK8826460.1 flippase-like domain-containing protein [Natroniella acetigena]
MFKKIIPFLILIAILLASFFIIDWESTAEVLRHTNYFVIFSLCILQLISLTITSYQWYILISKFQKPLSFKKVMSIHLAAKFTENITPSVKVGGEATKLYLLNRLFKINYEKSTSLLLINKFASFLPFLVICSVFLGASIFTFKLPPAVYLSFLALSTTFIIIFLLYSKVSNNNSLKELSCNNSSKPSLINKFLKLSLVNKSIAFFSNAIEETNNLISNQELIKLYFLSAVVWFIYPIHVYYIISMLGVQSTFTLIAIATYSAYSVSMIPLSPGGLGSYEATMVLILTLNGISATNGLAIVLLTRLVTYLFPLLISGINTAFLSWRLSTE